MPTPKKKVIFQDCEKCGRTYDSSNYLPTRSPLQKSGLQNSQKKPNGRLLIKFASQLMSHLSLHDGRNYMMTKKKKQFLPMQQYSNLRSIPILVGANTKKSMKNYEKKELQTIKLFLVWKPNGAKN